MLTNFPVSNFFKDVFGNEAPKFGGTVACNFFNVVFGMTTSTTAFILPVNSYIVWMSLFVDTTFNNSPTLSVGNAASGTTYMNAQSVLGTAGPVYTTTWAASKWYTRLGSTETINITVGSNPSQGSAWVGCWYIIK